LPPLHGGLTLHAEPLGNLCESDRITHYFYCTSVTYSRQAIRRTL